MRSNEFAYLFDSRFPAVILEYSKCIKLHSYTSKYTSTQNLAPAGYTASRREILGSLNCNAPVRVATYSEQE